MKSATKAVITNRQKALLHIAALDVGIDTKNDRELYEEILLNYGGVRSSVDLTPAAFDKVMRHLKSLGFAGKRPGKRQNKDYRHNKNYKHNREKWASLGLRAGMATPEQLARIECDWDGLSWWWDKDGKGHRERALRGFLKKRFDRSDLRVLTQKDAFKVIEALKNITKRKGKRNNGHAWVKETTAMSAGAGILNNSRP